MRLEDVLNLPPELIRRFRLKNLDRKCEKHRVGGVFTRDELLEYMRRNGVRTIAGLLAVRKDGEPLPGTYRKEFGSWSAAVKAAWGAALVEPGHDGKYCLSAARQMNILTFRQYLEARRLYPDLVPSVYWVWRNFGTFGEFQCYVRASNFQDSMDAYAKTYRKLGRPPTREECARVGLVLDVLLGFFESKAEMDGLMGGLEDKRRRDEGQGRGA